MVIAFKEVLNLINSGFSLATWSTLFSLIKDIITALAAIVGIYVALKGLSAWKKQLRGKTEYELARRFMRAAYKVRDAVNYVRDPFIPISEMDEALTITGKNNDNPERFEGNQAIRSVYHVRWKKVTEALSDLDLEVLEAEVSWGGKALSAQKHLRECVGKLRGKIWLHLYQRDNPSEKQQQSSMDSVLYNYDDGQIPNEFTTELNTAVKEVETFLKPHLR